MTRSVRLTLAGARSARARRRSDPDRIPFWLAGRMSFRRDRFPLMPDMRSGRVSAAAGPLGLGDIGCRGRLFEPGLELFLDLDQLLGLRLEVAGMRPLEARFEQIGRASC